MAGVGIVAKSPKVRDEVLDTIRLVFTVAMGREMADTGAIAAVRAAANACTGAAPKREAAVAVSPTAATVGA